MPTAAPVDTQGTELFFTDSGVVGSTDYTTVVLFHGAAFTGVTFHKLLPFASPDNIRLVIPNRRDYAGSTKYTDADIDDLNAGRKIFMERRGLEVANFLLWFIDEHHIPRISPDRKSGGLVILGWSLGNATTLALLGQSDAIPQETFEKLEPYLRTLIMHDSADLSFEYQETTSNTHYNPDTFNDAVASYYAYPDPEKPTACVRITDRPCSHKNMTADAIDMKAAMRAEFAMFRIPIRAVLIEQRRKALFDEIHAREILPNLRVVFISAGMTVVGCKWAKLVVERHYNEATQAGRRVRPIRFIDIEGANHFVHWDDPNTFWAALMDSIAN